MRIQPVREYLRNDDSIVSTTYLNDGRFLVIDFDEAGLKARGVRLVTDWASSIATP